MANNGKNVHLLYLFYLGVAYFGRLNVFFLSANIHRLSLEIPTDGITGSRITLGAVLVRKHLLYACMLHHICQVGCECSARALQPQARCTLIPVLVKSSSSVLHVITLGMLPVLWLHDNDPRNGIQGCVSQPLSCVKFVVNCPITTKAFHNPCRALKSLRRCR